MQGARGDWFDAHVLRDVFGDTKARDTMHKDIVLSLRPQPVAEYAREEYTSDLSFHDHIFTGYSDRHSGKEDLVRFLENGTPLSKISSTNYVPTPMTLLPPHRAQTRPPIQHQSTGG
jgi:hypothetical protein